MLSAQCLDERRKGVGGSDCAAIMGINPWRSAYRVYQEKRKEVEDWSGNDATEWGHRLEPTIRQFYSDVTGREVRLPDKILASTQYPFMLANLDGFTDDGRIVEIKTSRSNRGWGEPGTNQVPDYYLLQVQHYMIVTGFQVADIPVSIGGALPVIYEVPADPELQALIIEAEREFWERVESGNPPDPVTYADAIARFGQSKSEGTIIASQDLIDAYAELKTIRNRKDELEEREADLKGQIIIAMGERADTLMDAADNVLITYKLVGGRELFDAKTFRKDQPDLYKHYVKHTESQRRFLLKG